MEEEDSTIFLERRDDIKIGIIYLHGLKSLRKASTFLTYALELYRDHMKSCTLNFSVKRPKVKIVTGNSTLSNFIIDNCEKYNLTLKAFEKGCLICHLNQKQTNKIRQNDCKGTIKKSKTEVTIAEKLIPCHLNYVKKNSSYFPNNKTCKIIDICDVCDKSQVSTLMRCTGCERNRHTQCDLLGFHIPSSWYCEECWNDDIPLYNETENEHVIRSLLDEKQLLEFIRSNDSLHVDETISNPNTSSDSIDNWYYTYANRKY